MAQLITIDDTLAGATLKQFFRHHYPRLPYPLIQTWLRKGEVKVNGKKTNAEQVLNHGDIVKLPPPHFMAVPETPAKLDAATARRKLTAIMVADEADYSVINKPAGLAVQGGSGIGQSLDDWLIALNRAGGGNHYRLVHRLDRDTSGVMVLAKNRAAAQDLTAQFRTRQVEKIYLAVVRSGGAPLPATITAAIKEPTTARWEKMTIAEAGDPAALPAETHLETLAEKNGLALLCLRPLTGRKHQLRLHLAHVGAPILGDKKYGEGNKATPLPPDLGKKLAGHLLLHAHAITLAHGATHLVPPPDYFPLDFFGFHNGDDFRLAIGKKK